MCQVQCGWPTQDSMTNVRLHQQNQPTLQHLTTTEVTCHPWARWKLPVLWTWGPASLGVGQRSLCQAGQPLGTPQPSLLQLRGWWQALCSAEWPHGTPQPSLLFTHWISYRRLPSLLCCGLRGGGRLFAQLSHHRGILSLLCCGLRGSGRLFAQLSHHRGLPSLLCCGLRGGGRLFAQLSDHRRLPSLLCCGLRGGGRLYS